MRRRGGRGCRGRGCGSRGRRGACRSVVAVVCARRAGREVQDRLLRRAERGGRRLLLLLRVMVVRMMLMLGGKLM